MMAGFLEQESIHGIAEVVRVALQDAAQLDSGTLSRIVLAKCHDGKALRESFVALFVLEELAETSERADLGADDAQGTGASA